MRRTPLYLLVCLALAWTCPPAAAEPDLELEVEYDAPDPVSDIHIITTLEYLNIVIKHFLSGGYNKCLGLFFPFIIKDIGQGDVGYIVVNDEVQGGGGGDMVDTSHVTE